MKLTMKSLLALLLALGLLFSLAACSLFDPELMEEPPEALDPLPEPGAATLAYFDEKVLPLLPESKDYTVEVSYSIGDVQVENEAFKAALPEIKKLLTNGLGKKEADLKFGEGAYPLLRNPLRMEDVAEIKADSVLELKIAEALVNVRADYDRKFLEAQTLKQTLQEYGEMYEGLKGDDLDTWVEETMKDEDLTLRLYTIQSKVGDVYGAKTHYQLEITLQPGMALEDAARYIEPEDKEAILKEFAKADAYLKISDYEKTAWVDKYSEEEIYGSQADEDQKLRDLTPTYRIVCRVDNTNNHLEELTLVARYDVSAELQGTGGLAEEGAFTASAPFTKTVKITFEWPEPPAEG